MSFVPAFTDFLLTHLQQEERKRILKSIVVTVAPELWLSLESAALLDIYRNRFGLGGQLDDHEAFKPDCTLSDRINVPRWLIAAERRKVDIWVEDSYGEAPSKAIEFKIVHNNKNAYEKIKGIREDLIKPIPSTKPNEVIERWGIVLLVYSRFYQDQQGGYSYGKFATCEEFLNTFSESLSDSTSRYASAPQLELAMAPTLVTDLCDANYIVPGNGAGVYLALVKPRQTAFASLQPN
ncbi:hypothetical protein ABH905_003981 [Pseudomonas frederiksbergensis]|uniref:hypothetical protein n=1 Tax=Pseudomonas frederiksbergensis TaxID=104087 RepID=UPI003D1B8F2E